MNILTETKNYKAIQYSDRIEIIGKANKDRNRNEIVIESILNTKMNIGFAIRYVERFEKFNG